MAEDKKVTVQATEHKKKVNLELEVDATAKDLGVNPYANWVNMDKAVDS